MIVRISGEGQYQLGDSYLERLNDLDNQIVERVNQNDEAGFTSLLQEMIGFVRENGTALPAEELAASDVILPPSDITLADAQHLFQGEGLVPG